MDQQRQLELYALPDRQPMEPTKYWRNMLTAAGASDKTPVTSVTFVHSTQAIEIFGNVSMPFGTLAICDPSVKILRRSSQGNPSVEGLNQRGVEKCSDFGPLQGDISETVQDRR